MKKETIRLSHKLIIYIGICILIFTFSPTHISAQSTLLPSHALPVFADTISPCSDSLVYRYRHRNGYTERRLWNKTKRKWAESSWHRV